MNQDSICKEFCDGLRVREVRNGYAISTQYTNFLGDSLAFYALRDGEEGEFRIFDDGTIIPHLEAAGATLENSMRYAALAEILKGHHAHFDEVRGELFMRVERGDNLSRAILDFIAVLLRVNDLLFMVQERAENTFKEDVRIQVMAALSGRASVRENEPVNDTLKEIVPDMVLRADDRDPVALFIATSASKLHEAIQLHMMAMHEHPTPLKVIAMLEDDASIGGRVRVRADNRLDAVPRFRLEENAAIERVQREVLGWQAFARSRAH